MNVTLIMALGLIVEYSGIALIMCGLATPGLYLLCGGAFLSTLASGALILGDTGGRQ